MEPPVKPDESDCCNSDCHPCILDVYEEQLKKYNKRKLADLDRGQTYFNCISQTTYSVFQVFHIEPHAGDALLISLEYVKPSKASKKPLDDSCRLFYEAGQYFLLKAGPKNDEFTRAYTPIPSSNHGKRFTILVKLYEDGRMSKYIRLWKELKETEWRGPYGDYFIEYTNKHMFMVAQGSGIAPIYSIIRKLIDNEDCSTFIKLFYCCRSQDQIYLRDQLYELQLNWNFTYEIFLKNSKNLTEKFNELVHYNRLESGMIQSYLEDKIEGLQVLICGSETFEKSIKEYVVSCNVEEKNIFLF